MGFGKVKSTTKASKFPPLPSLIVTSTLKNRPYICPCIHLSPISNHLWLTVKPWTRHVIDRQIHTLHMLWCGDNICALPVPFHSSAFQLTCPCYHANHRGVALSTNSIQRIMLLGRCSSLQGSSSPAGDREVCSSHLSSPGWPPKGRPVPAVCLPLLGGPACNMCTSAVKRKCWYAQRR